MPATENPLHAAPVEGQLGNVSTGLANFRIEVRTGRDITRYTTPADSAISAFIAAVDAQGDTPCGITVKPMGGAL